VRRIGLADEQGVVAGGGQYHRLEAAGSTDRHDRRARRLPGIAARLHEADGISEAYRCEVDERDPLADEPFSHLERADGSVVIRYHAAPVTVLRGRAAERFRARIDGADAAAAQQLMARATGNFRRGNERRGAR
jgi:hypothetical protein